MSREHHQEVRTEQMLHVWETAKCDKCGKEISYDLHAEEAAHELILMLDQDQCVNFYRRRDYCDDCFAQIWEMMNSLIGVNEPYMERDREYE
jgi:hypothetical protein